MREEHRGVRLAELLGLEMADLKLELADLTFTGFDLPEIEKLLKPSDADDERANEAPALPEVAVSQPGDLWLLGEAPKCPHCGAEN